MEGEPIRARPAWSVHPDEWRALLVERGMRAFRADQILQALYRDWIQSWDEATTLPKDLRADLAREFPLAVPKVLASERADDGTTKLLLGLTDGNSVETVVIPAGTAKFSDGRPGRLTQCISSQVGCAMGCAFCASGAKGLVRSLASDEIVAQVMCAQHLFATPENKRQGSGLCLTNLVVMGMGEPFANYDETMRALKILNAGKGPNLGARHITLSTCGVVPGFKRLAAEGLQFELSVSLHAPNDELRSQLMPVNRRWPIDELLAACREYTRETGRVITFEYTLVKGLNDSRACARAGAPPEDAAFVQGEPHTAFAGGPSSGPRHARRGHAARLPRCADEGPHPDDAQAQPRQGRRRSMRPAPPSHCQVVAIGECLEQLHLLSINAW